MQIGQRIQNVGLEKGMSGIEVAAYLNIKKKEMSRIECGKENYTAEQLVILAQLLDCSIDYLFFGKEKEPLLSMEQKAAVNAFDKAFLKKSSLLRTNEGVKIAFRSGT